MEGVRRLGRRLRASGHGPGPGRSVQPGAGYAEWIALHERPDLPGAGTGPSPLVRVTIEGAAEAADTDVALARTLRSLHAQRHTGWVAVDPRGTLLAAGASPADGRDASTADAAALRTWVEAGDQLAPDALSAVVAVFETDREAWVVFTDEDVWSDGQSRTQPRFKPGVDLELLRAGHALGSLTVVREPAGQRPGASTDSPLDQVLQVIESAGERAVVHLPRVLCHRASTPPAASQTDLAAIERHLRRTAPGAELHVDAASGAARVVYPLPSALPSVTLVMPTRNQPGRLRAAVTSLLSVTAYGSFDLLLVDNGSDMPEALSALRDLAVLPRVQVRRDDRPFNWSALNNAAAADARGDLLCFINDDVEACDAAWLDEMVRLAVRPDVGVVGARLWYPDRTVQHAGLVLNPEAGASHLFQHLPESDDGYLGLAAVARRVSAVTGACLLVRRELFVSVGGFDETLPSDFNDVDFCLRLADAGFRTLWTPHANLVHHEGASRGTWDDPAHRRRFTRAHAQFVRRWGARLDGDPHFNPNLSVSRENPPLAWPPRAHRR